MGISYDHNTWTKNSANSGRSIQLTPFAAKVNQITISDIDDPHEARSFWHVLIPSTTKFEISVVTTYTNSNLFRFQRSRLQKWNSMLRYTTKWSGLLIETTSNTKKKP